MSIGLPDNDSHRPMPLFKLRCCFEDAQQKPSRQVRRSFLPIFNLHGTLYLSCKEKHTQYIIFVNAHLNRVRKMDRLSVYTKPDDKNCQSCFGWILAEKDT